MTPNIARLVLLSVIVLAGSALALEMFPVFAGAVLLVCAILLLASFIVPKRSDRR